jgi:hypothetical protein
MRALGFARKGKIVCENANQFSCSDFFYWQIFSKVSPEKYDFFPYKVVVSFLLSPFLSKKLRKFWQNVLFKCTFNYFFHFGRNVCQFLYEKKLGKSPDMKDIHGKFQPNFPNFENGKSSTLPFLNDK